MKSRSTKRPISPSPFRKQLDFQVLEHRQMLTGMPEFFADVDPQAGYSNLRGFAAAGPVTYFRADAAATGSEVWKTDGTASGTALVKDIWPGAGTWINSDLLPVNDQVIFSARTPSEVHYSLWTSDSSRGARKYYSSIYRENSALPQTLTSLGFAALFVSYANQLWITDGTAAGTLGLTENRVAYDGSKVRAAAVGSTVFFVAENESGYELWKSDGTAESTQIVRDISPGLASSSPSQLTNVNGTLFFVANDGVNGPALWKSDGTEMGTVLVKDIDPSTTSGTIEGLAAFGNKLLFSADDGVNGLELWISDGTNAGTTLLADLASGLTSSSVQSITTAGGFAFFVANDGVHGEQLWQTDGTAAGTSRLTEFTSDPRHAGPYRLTAVGSNVFFISPQGELWQSSGFNAAPVVDAAGNTFAVTDASLGVIGGSLLFPASRGLWKTDGTPDGTQFVAPFRGAGSEPENLTDVDGTLFFTARDRDNDVELWKTDGTLANTQRVVDTDINSDGPIWPDQLLNHQGKLLFRASAHVFGQTALWISDGTSEGTKKLVSFPKDHASLGVDELSVGSHAFYSFLNIAGGRELWVTDGTTDGTVLLKEFPGFTLVRGSGVENFAELNGKLYFTFYDPVAGSTLWTSDGTPQGTVVVTSLSNDRESSTLDMEAFNGSLYISSGQRLWKSDGTAAGTVPVDDLDHRGRHLNMTAVGPYLFYWLEGQSPSTLWRTDGTPAGTIPLMWSDRPDPSDNRVRGSAGNIFYFSRWHVAQGEELWRSDGTPEGTYLLQDIAQPGGSTPLDYAVSKDMLYFTAADDARGRTLWRLKVPSNPTVQTSGTIAYAENGLPAGIATDAVIADTDSPHFNGGSLTVKFATGPESTDRLTIRSASDLVVSGNELKFKGILIGTFIGGVGAEPLVVAFNEKASPYRAQIVLRNITYRSLSENPNDVPRKLVITLTDGDGGKSDPVTKSLTTTPVNDAPKLNTALSPTLTAINEDNRNSWGTPVWTLLPGFSDVDSGALKGLAITSASGRVNGAWQYTLDGGATWLDLGAVSLSSANLLPAQGNLSRVRFVPNANFHGTVQLGYLAWDQTQGSAGGTFDLSGSGKLGGTTAFSWGFEAAGLTVTAVNDVPVVTLPSATMGYALNSPAVLLASTATVKDPDSTNFAGGWLKVQVTAGADVNDRLSIGGPFKVVDGDLIWNNQATIGTVKGGTGSAALTINLNAQATLYRVEQLMRSIKFGTLGSSKPGQRTVATSLCDGLNNSNVATLDVQVA